MMSLFIFFFIFFFKQKTAYEMRISDWSSDVCSSDLSFRHVGTNRSRDFSRTVFAIAVEGKRNVNSPAQAIAYLCRSNRLTCLPGLACLARAGIKARSEEHTSELQSLMRISYAVFCLKKKTHIHSKDIQKRIMTLQTIHTISYITT